MFFCATDIAFEANNPHCYSNKFFSVSGHINILFKYMCSFISGKSIKSKQIRVLLNFRSKLLNC